MPSQFFDKYDSLLGKPNGRPVGVRNGQGQQPSTPANPAMDGMKHTVGDIVGKLMGPPKPLPSIYDYKPLKRVNTQQPTTLAVAQKRASMKQERGLQDQTSVRKEIEILNSWDKLFQ